MSSGALASASGSARTVATARATSNWKKNIVGKFRFFHFKGYGPFRKKFSANVFKIVPDTL